MAGGLAAFLDQAARTPFAAGHNCLLFAADWCVARGRPDPAAADRGLSWLAAARRLRQAGGLVAFAEARMAAAGYRPAEAPAAGDVGVVAALSRRGPQPMGAVFTGAVWAVLAPGGLVLAPLPVLKAWRV